MAETRKFKIIELTQRQWTPTYVDGVDVGTWGSIQRATCMIKIRCESPLIYPAKSSIKVTWNDNYVGSKEIDLGSQSFSLNFDLTGMVVSGKNKFHMDYIIPFGAYIWIDYLYCEVEVTGEGYLPPVPPPPPPNPWEIAWWIILIVIIVALIASLAWSLPRIKKVLK